MQKVEKEKSLLRKLSYYEWNFWYTVFYLKECIEKIRLLLTMHRENCVRVSVLTMYICSGQQVMDLFLTVPEDLFVTVHEEDHSKKYLALFIIVTVQRAIT